MHAVLIPTSLKGRTRNRRNTKKENRVTKETVHLLYGQIFNRRRCDCPEKRRWREIQ